MPTLQRKDAKMARNNLVCKYYQSLAATLSLWEFLILCLCFIAILKAAHDAKVGKKELKKLRQYLDSRENRQWLSRDTT